MNKGVCVCGRVVFDGEIIKSRCVNAATAEALCRCKRWVPVPVGMPESDLADRVAFDYPTTRQRLDEALEAREPINEDTDRAALHWIITMEQAGCPELAGIIRRRLERVHGVDHGAEPLPRAEWPAHRLHMLLLYQIGRTDLQPPFEDGPLRGLAGLLQQWHGRVRDELKRRGIDPASSAADAEPAPFGE